MGTKIMRMTDAIVPITMKGVLLPHFLTSLPLALSEILPNSGSMKRESRLSRPMIKPRTVLERP